MRLIDADALLEDIGEEPMNWTNSPEEIQEYSDWKQTVATINSAPTIDAVPVVRCKDCKNNNQCSIRFKFADADNSGNWFCAYGKRR